MEKLIPSPVTSIEEQATEDILLDLLAEKKPHYTLIQ